MIPFDFTRQSLYLCPLQIGIMKNTIPFLSTLLFPLLTIAYYDDYFILNKKAFFEADSSIMNM
jgi:hypothetical protein